MTTTEEQCTIVKEQNSRIHVLITTQVPFHAQLTSVKRTLEDMQIDLNRIYFAYRLHKQNQIYSKLLKQFNSI